MLKKIFLISIALALFFNFGNIQGYTIPGGYSVTTTPAQSLIQSNSGTILPSTTAFDPITGSKISINGLNYEVYNILQPANGSWPTRIYQMIKPGVIHKTGAGITSSITIPPNVPEDQFLVRFEGYINIPQEALYTFSLYSDDGARMWVDGVSLVNNDGLHSARLRSSSPRKLSAGLHPIKIEYFESSGGQVFKAYWSSASILQQEIPAGVLSPKTENFDNTPDLCPLTVNAGTDQQLSASTTSTRITGTVACAREFSWSKVSGPGSATVYRPKRTSSRVYGLIPGTHVFLLTATDSLGNSKSDEVIIKIGSTQTPVPTPSVPVAPPTIPTTPTLPTTPTAPTTPTTNTNNTTTQTTSTKCLVTNPIYTYYASPSGGGDGKSINTPFQIADFWKVAKAGDTLGLMDGRYTGANSMINPPANLSGLSGKPITIRAINEGWVDIDGEKKFAPIELEYNNWFVLEGIDARNAGGSEPSVSVVTLKYSSNNILRCMTGQDAGDGNTNIFGVHNGNDNLLEDVAGWGIARKIFSNSQGGNNTTFRRAWGRWDGGHTEGPKKIFTLSYNTYNALCENCIATWGSLKMKKDYELTDYYGKGLGQFFSNYQVYNPEGMISADSFDVNPTQNANIKVFGSIAYLKPETRYHNSPRKWAGPYSMDINGVLIENSISIIEPEGHTDILPMNLGDDFATPANNKIKNMTVIGKATPNITNAWTQENTYKSNSCANIISGGGNVVNPAVGAISGGARIMKRYVNGVETNQDLWPWPMNERIKKAMIRGGYEPVDVTKTIFELCGGKLPASLSAVGDTTTNQPAPNPTPVVPTNLNDIVATAKSWLVATPANRAPLEAKLKSWNQDIDSVIAAVKPGNYIETQTGEVFYQDFKTPEFAQKYPGHKYHMHVPTHYKPGTPIGLMFWLHGGGSCSTMAEDLKHLEDYEMDDEKITGRSGARTEVDKSNYILVAPIGPCAPLLPHKDHASRWDVPITDQYLIDLMTEIDSRYNINEDKVVMAGFSMGGIGAYHQALRLSDRFSAVMASAGSWELGSWDALVNTPLYLIHGTKDAYYSGGSCRNHNTAIEYARYARDLAVGANPNSVLYEYPGGHGWDDVGQNAWTNFINGTNGWVTSKTRNPYASRTVAMNPWRSYISGSNYNVTWNEDPSPHTLWVSVNGVGPGTIMYDYARESGDGSCSSEASFNNWSLIKDKKSMNGAKVDAKVTGPNAVSVSSQNATDISLWLHPKMNIDFSKPISVTVDGVTTQKTCTPSLLDALRSYERRDDWQMIYHCELDVK